MSQLIRPNAQGQELARAALTQPSQAVAELKPNRRRLLAGIALGLSLVLAGAGLVAGACWAGWSPWVRLPGLALALAGTGLILVMKRLASLRVWVSPNGFAIVTLGTGDRCCCYRIESGEPTSPGPSAVEQRVNEATASGTEQLAQRKEEDATNPGMRSRRQFRGIRLEQRPRWPQEQSTGRWAPPAKLPRATPRSWEAEPTGTPDTSKGPSGAGGPASFSPDSTAPAPECEGVPIKRRDAANGPKAER
jgi:hypothetical protein